MTDPAEGGIIYFADYALKAGFQKRRRENKKDLKDQSCFAGFPPGITSPHSGRVIPDKSGPTFLHFAGLLKEIMAEGDNPSIMPEQEGDAIFF
jgi:hypothetical protein